MPVVATPLRVLAPWLAALALAALSACQPPSRGAPMATGLPALQGKAEAATAFVAQREWLSFSQALHAPSLTLPAAALACLEQLAPDDFVPLAHAVLHTQFKAAERDQANAFFDSPAGQQLAAAVLATLNGQPQAMAQMGKGLSAADAQAQARFTQTPIGLLLVGGLDPKSRAQLDAAVQQRTRSCFDLASTLAQRSVQYGAITASIAAEVPAY